MRVLESFPAPRPTTNPYVVQLARSLQERDGVDVVFFSWPTGLLGRYDVFHVHWPEIMLEARHPLRRVQQRVFTLLFCLRLLVTRTPVVRTWHNTERPSGIAWFDHRILDLLDRLTTLRIRLNDSTEMPPDAPYRTILHGHYRDWFAELPRSEPDPGRLAFVGRIRRYKGVEALLEAFRGLPDPDASLTVAGLPSSDELVATLTELTGGDPRVELRFEYVDDAALVTTVTRASVVVLPYRHMHNSGTALAALSLDRPVLVPDNEVNRRLAQEVGPGWVHLYDDEVSAQRLAEVLAEVATRPSSAVPDLSAREWEQAGADHAAAFREALDERVSSRTGRNR